jgi:hypothetical protein
VGVPACGQEGLLLELPAGERVVSSWPPFAAPSGVALFSIRFTRVTVAAVLWSQHPCWTSGSPVRVSQQRITGTRYFSRAQRWMRAVSTASDPVLDPASRETRFRGNKPEDFHCPRWTQR